MNFLTFPGLGVFQYWERGFFVLFHSLLCIQSQKAMVLGASPVFALFNQQIERKLITIFISKTVIYALIMTFPFAAAAYDQFNLYLTDENDERKNVKRIWWKPSRSFRPFPSSFMATLSAQRKTIPCSDLAQTMAESRAYLFAALDWHLKMATAIPPDNPF